MDEGEDRRIDEYVVYKKRTERMKDTKWRNDVR